MLGLLSWLLSWFLNENPNCSKLFTLLTSLLLGSYFYFVSEISLTLPHFIPFLSSFCHQPEDTHTHNTHVHSLTPTLQDAYTPHTHTHTHVWTCTHICTQSWESQFSTVYVWALVIRPLSEFFHTLETGGIECVYSLMQWVHICKCNWFIK